MSSAAVVTATLRVEGLLLSVFGNALEVFGFHLLRWYGQIRQPLQIKKYFLTKEY